MSTIPDLSQVQAVSFDNMAFKIGLFQFSNAVAWVFNVYKYNEVTNAHTVVCFVAGKHAGRDALLARKVLLYSSTYSTQVSVQRTYTMKFRCTHKSH